MKLHKLLVPAIAMVGSQIAYTAEEGITLDCKRYDGEQDFQIYLNETEGYVIYNSQNYDSYERHQEITLENSDENAVLDVGLEISTNNSAFILADSDTASFVLVKSDASFAYSWVNPIHIRDGIFDAFGFYHDGSCSVNPFNE